MHQYRLQVLGMLVALALVVRGCNDDGGENSAWNHAGSTWRITVEIAQDYQSGEHAEWPYNDGPSQSSYVGTFRIPDSPRTTDSSLYDIEQITLSGTVKYIHRAVYPIREGDYYCSGSAGSFPIGSHMHLTGTYIVYDESRDFDPAGLLLYDAGISRFFIGLNILPSENTADNSNYAFSYSCTFDDGGTFTYYLVAPPHWANYAGEAATRTVIWIKEEPSTISFNKIRLECLSNCAPPTEHPIEEPEEEECNPEEPLNRCREAREPLLKFCRTLQDWMVVEDTSGSEPQVTCADADCTGAQAANAGTAPWVGITEHYSSACSELAGDVACSVECYGWGKAQAP